MDRPSARLSLLALYTERMEECRDFYSELGLELEQEQHGSGPRHYAAVLAGGTVFEIYPATDRRPTGRARLGLTLTAAAADPPLPMGRHVRTDPDGRKVDVQAE